MITRSFHISVCLVKLVMCSDIQYLHVDVGWTYGRVAHFRINHK